MIGSYLQKVNSVTILEINAINHFSLWLWSIPSLLVGVAVSHVTVNVSSPITRVSSEGNVYATGLQNSMISSNYHAFVWFIVKNRCETGQAPRRNGVCKPSFIFQSYRTMPSHKWRGLDIFVRSDGRVIRPAAWFNRLVDVCLQRCALVSKKYYASLSKLISIAQRKAVVTIFITHWSYRSLALRHQLQIILNLHIPDSKVHGANMGPSWVLSAPVGPHVAP